MTPYTISKMHVIIYVIHPATSEVIPVRTDNGKNKEVTVAGAGVRVGIPTNRLIAALAGVCAFNKSSYPIAGCILTTNNQKPVIISYEQHYRYMLYLNNAPLRFNPLHQCGYTIREITNHLQLRGHKISVNEIRYGLNGNPMSTFRAGEYSIKTFIPLSIRKCEFTKD